MAAYDYVAVDLSGRQKKGVIEGDSQRQVRQTLRDKGFVPLSVDPSAKKTGDGKSFQFGGGRSMSVRDLALVTRQMATLVHAGLPLEEVLSAVSQQTEKNKIRSIMMAVRSKVMEGYTLAASMAEFPKAFPHLYCATISAGEHSGHLDLVMNRLADYTESSHATRQKMTMALVYPALLLVISIVIVIFLMVTVVPGVIDVFNNNNQELPGITVALVAISDFLSNYYLYLLGALILSFIIVKTLLKNEAILLVFDHQILHLPMIGKLSRNINTARYASTLSILTTSGVTLVDGMKIAGQVLSNTWLKVKVKQAMTLVSEGSSLKNALEQAGYFPPMMLHMIASGESSGELDTMLERTARSQEMDLENFISVMVGLVPPIIILLMGGMVFMIVLAILLPIFQLNQMVG